MQAEGSLPTEGVKVLVAGLARNTSQKLHNMIYAIERVDEAAELVLMLDDDMLMVRASAAAHGRGLVLGANRLPSPLLRHWRAPRWETCHHT